MTPNSDLLTYTQWMGILTAVIAVITVLAFILKWGFRFRLVGVTSFMGVLTFGIFALSLALYTRAEIPGAVRYTLVYDTGGAQTVIAVSPNIGESGVRSYHATSGGGFIFFRSWGTGKRPDDYPGSHHIASKIRGFGTAVFG